MNVKTLVAITVSSLLAASLSYSASNPNITTDILLADNSTSGSSVAGMSGSSGAATVSGSAAATDSSSNGNASGDDMSADTATGDDDY